VSSVLRAVAGGDKAVVLPGPAVVAVSILLFMGYWNNFLGPAIYIDSDKWKTLPLALAGFQSVNGTVADGNLSPDHPALPDHLLRRPEALTNGITFTGGK